MECVNFDEQFQAYASEWVRQHAAEFGNNADRMEDEMPALYERWLNTPADFLDGACPATFFERYDDASYLRDYLLAYCRQDVPVPDLLLDRLVALGDDAQRALLHLLFDEAAPEEAVLIAISLLTELESREPLSLYIRWILQRQPKDERADMAAEALVAMGECVVPAVLAAYDGASRDAQETFLDILGNFPSCKETFALVMARLEQGEEHIAFLAALLGKLGDARAVPVLLETMNRPELNYLDYIELRNAVEALGADVPQERDFHGDPYYESLSRME